jgi:hypothetical protein
MKRLNIIKVVKRFFLFTTLILIYCKSYSQINNPWLIGNDPVFVKARIIFDTTSYNLIVPDNRIMTFRGTEATISDKNGNFLMSSNGVWIADATGNLMMNGDSLNPGVEVNGNPRGLLLEYANIFLPYPDDSNKYVLFHHTCDYDGFSYPAYEVFYSVIDMAQNGGLGGVDSAQKNVIAFQDTLGWGLAACRHANGRDWWIIALKNQSDVVFKILFTPSGIASITQQSLNVPYIYYGNAQPTFSPDGKKFAYVYGDAGTIVNFDIRIFDFDRCTGMFSNEHWIDLSDGYVGFGCAFSPNSEFVYASTPQHIFQINTNTFFVDTIATYDGFYSPYTWCCQTSFFNMYLAANGKIYITSGSGVQHIHEMNYPDSAGTACDLQQHAINLGTWSFRAVPNHPNYYLGCDTTSGCPCLDNTGITEVAGHNFKFAVSPNPTTGNIKIVYLLPQNKKGLFEVFDVMGKKVFSYVLPPWSTLQNFDLRFLGGGVYNCVITCNNYRTTKKLAIIK